MRVASLIMRLVVAGAPLLVWCGAIKVPDFVSVSSGANCTTVVSVGLSALKSADVSQQLETSISEIDIVPSFPALPASFEQSITNDPYIYKQWALIRVQASGFKQTTTRDRKVIVAILDTGIDINHEDLNGKVVTEVNFTISPTSDDVYGHGTHIAGIIAATSNNSMGIAGLAPKSGLMNIKVADDYGRCQSAIVAKGVVWAVDNGANVINISLEINEPSRELEEAIDYAWSRGILVVAAAGNQATGLPIYPACYKNCIAVTATDQDDSLAPLSNRGDWVDVAAPGFNIYSTMPGDDYGYESGTSFATAYVSGLAALLYGMVNDTNGNGRVNDEVRTAIEAGCDKIGVAGVGGGRINVTRSLSLLSSALQISCDCPSQRRGFIL